mmetsp:Transcript_13320/g.48483  ORF Transcript_13320/g.48483 Transcript_13320/m.48483 type:complete len:223 (+) Transcript_13320:100-768(+)|eukprot:scaffold167_cov347-Prasinococcus_capsulatus_cf.AAC.4
MPRAAPRRLSVCPTAVCGQAARPRTSTPLRRPCHGRTCYEMARCQGMGGRRPPHASTVASVTACSGTTATEQQLLCEYFEAMGYSDEHELRKLTAFGGGGQRTTVLQLLKLQPQLHPSAAVAPAAASPNNPQRLARRVKGLQILLPEIDVLNLCSRHPFMLRLEMSTIAAALSRLRSALPPDVDACRAVLVDPSMLTLDDESFRSEIPGLIEVLSAQEPGCR